MTGLVVVTDLDGTLLDHDTYSAEPARPALAAMAERGIPLIMASSKTRAEMRALQQTLNIHGPFICENGAAICVPPAGESGDADVVEALVPPRTEVLAVLRRLRDDDGFRFKGFADCDTEEIAGMTGLPLEQAVLAAEREYSEPLCWQDSEQRKTRFLEALATAGLSALQGGRFLSVAGRTNKGRALARLRERYAGARIIALGDSPNDEAMLSAADIAVIIKSARSESMRAEGAGRVLRTTLPGPDGWREAVLPLLEEFQ
ncbi:MAG: HAD-IIB family hydrolase [Halieaceae bacterium]|nr:HAD-IIB family hydrolase [Halieaceae bacterium]